MTETFNPFSIDDRKSSDYADLYDPDVHFFNKISIGSTPCSYYNENDFHSLIETSTKSTDIFSSLHINIRSLPKNNLIIIYQH